MSSQIRRPSMFMHEKGEWQIVGSWGRRVFPSMSKVALCTLLHRELINCGILPVDSPRPNKKYHSDVTDAVCRSSWIAGQWVADEPFAARLKKLRNRASLTQEKLAEKSRLDVATIHQLEQGTPTDPLWQMVCALARGLELDVVVFVGTDAWHNHPSEDQDLPEQGSGPAGSQSTARS
jgi:DNA-binding XRE family transcriptional regulator